MSEQAGQTEQTEQTGPTPMIYVTGLGSRGAFDASPCATHGMAAEIAEALAMEDVEVTDLRRAQDGSYTLTVELRGCPVLTPEQEDYELARLRMEQAEQALRLARQAERAARDALVGERSR